MRNVERSSGFAKIMCDAEARGKVGGDLLRREMLHAFRNSIPESIHFRTLHTGRHLAPCNGWKRNLQTAEPTRRCDPFFKISYYHAVKAHFIWATTVRLKKGRGQPGNIMRRHLNKGMQGNAYRVIESGDVNELWSSREVYLLSRHGRTRWYNHAKKAGLKIRSVGS